MATAKSQTIDGVGLGLRWDFIDEILEQKPALAFVEVSPENYMGRGGYYDEALERAKDIWPIVTHGLTMSLGGVDPLRDDYLAGLRDFIARTGSPWHSDHLCFSTFGGVVLHDLLPLAFKRSEVVRVADRIKRAQDAIGRPMAVENVSFYLHPGKREMTEAEFVASVCEEADCGLMLDVNNAWVNATNFGYDVDAWMRTIPLDRVVQMHVAGHDWFSEPSANGTKDFVLGGRPADLLEARGDAHRRQPRERRRQRGDGAPRAHAREDGAGAGPPRARPINPAARRAPRRGAPHRRGLAARHCEARPSFTRPRRTGG